MAKLDDFLSKKKDSIPTLDFAKNVPANVEEFRKMYDKVPDFKIKAEKVKTEELRIKEKNFKFKTGKRDYRARRKPFTFMDPLPQEMRKLNLEDLIPVAIDWRMLTTARPKTKLEEEYFSRIIELGKSELRTKAKEKRANVIDPLIRKTKNRTGIPEMRVVSCKECEEDFCNGKNCTKFTYESFARIGETTVQVPLKNATDTGKDKHKKRAKSKNRVKSLTRKSRSKSPKKVQEKANLEKGKR